MNCKIFDPDVEYEFLHFVNGLQIVLAIGNYMNSAKRGPVYGFKLQSLDMVMCLIKYIYIMPWIMKFHCLLQSFLFHRAYHP